MEPKEKQSVVRRIRKTIKDVVFDMNKTNDKQDE
jgi:hypothetical protein